MILAGRDEDGADVPVPEVWSPAALRALTGASRVLPLLPARVPRAERPAVLRRRTAQTTRYLNITGAGSWTTVGQPQRSPTATTARR